MHNLGPQIPAIEITDIAQELERGSILIDVREQHEWDAGHAPDALHFPLQRLHTMHTELSAGTRYLAICRSGSRSRVAAELLLRLGYTAVNVRGGMLAWEEAGYPVQSHEGSPGSVL